MDTRPSFSVIIPTYNRPQQLAACLRSVAQLDYPPDRMEVIVVNDGGTRPAGAAGVLLVDQPNAGPAAARNAGAAQASGDFLAFVDDDCQPDGEWLTRLSRQLEQTPEGLVGGRTINVLPDNRYATASQLLVDYLYAYYNQGGAGPHFFTSNNMALATVLFRQMGGFEASFALAAGEDRDFCDRWRQAGWEMVYVPAAVMYHAHRLTWRSFWRQHVGYGRGAYHFHQRRQQRQQGQVKVEPLSFYTNLVLYPFRAANGGMGRVSTAVLLAITQLANVWGYFYQSRQQSG